MSLYAVVDSGTTTTRLRLWEEGEQIWSATRAAGARDTALDGDTRKLREALRELLSQAQSETGRTVDAVICSGMITSNMGLREVPHLPAPAGLDDLAAGIVQDWFPDLTGLPLSFIPGVKTLPESLDLANLAGADALRGEEAELAGLRSVLGLERGSVFLHLGSHHKAIDVDEQGRILGSRTAITGELLAAVSEQTILKGSLSDLDALELDLECAQHGARTAREQGVGRALFLVRVGDQLAGMDSHQTTSYLLGLLAALDLPLVENSALSRTAAGSESSDRLPVILYGAGHFRPVLSELLAWFGWEVRLVDTGTAEGAAAAGAVRIFERAAELRSVR